MIATDLQLYEVESHIARIAHTELYLLIQMELLQHLEFLSKQLCHESSLKNQGTLPFSTEKSILFHKHSSWNIFKYHGGGRGGKKKKKTNQPQHTEFQYDWCFYHMEKMSDYSTIHTL